MSQLLNTYLSCNNQVCTDTRNIVPGSLFFALKGANFNGNEFAMDALSKGASYAVIDEEQSVSDDRLILVEDVLQSLQDLANAYRKTFDIPVLGITGSNGKTTAKELIHAVLSKKFNCHATPGNFNNHIGLPLTILSMPKECEFLILEMGDNHMGEIKLLAEIGDPDYGLVTNVGKDHIEGFGSFENNKLAKKELFDYLMLHDATVFIPSFEEELSDMAKEVKQQVVFGQAGEFSHVDQLQSHPFVRYKVKDLDYSTNLIGDYNIKNIEMAVAIGRYFEVDEQLIHQAVTEYQPSNNRSQFIERGSNVIFLDAYNANPSSMELAIESFDKQQLRPNRFLILGDMLELGAESLNEHQMIADKAQTTGAKVFLVGSEFSKIKNSTKIQCFSDRFELIDFITANPIGDAQVLIKGSRGIRLEEVLNAL